MELVKVKSKDYQVAGAQPFLETTTGFSKMEQFEQLMISWGDQPGGPTGREAS